MPERRIPWNVDPYSLIPENEDIRDIRVCADGLIVTTVPREEVTHSPPSFAPSDIIEGQEAAAIMAEAGMEPPAATASTPDLEPFLFSKAMEVVSRIEAGDADGFLSELAEAERKARNRKTVLAAIERREAEVS